MLQCKAPDIFVNAEPVLRQADSEGVQVFYRTDHHWTTAGAYLAYRVYMPWLGKEPMPAEAFDSSVVSADFYGSQWSKNSLPGIVPDEINVFALREETGAVMDYQVEFFDGSNSWQASTIYQQEFLEQKDKYAYFLGQNQPLVVIRKADGRSGDAESEEYQSVTEPNGEQECVIAIKQKLLILKDSYAHCFAPFLLPHFDEIHLADLRYWRQDPIAYMEEQGIQQVLFLYNADSFTSDRSISLLGTYLKRD